MTTMGHQCDPPRADPDLGWPAPPPGLLDGLAAGCPYALVIADPAGRVQWANAAFAALTGFGAWDAAGRSLPGLLRLGTAADTPSLEVGDALAGGLALTTTVSMYRKDGQRRWLDLHLHPVTGGEGAATLSVGVLADVTERVQSGTRLAQAERLAAVGALASGVAHEIATPVQFVGDSVQFLRDALTDLASALAPLRALREAVTAGREAGPLAARAAEAEEAADLDYLLEHAPRALDACRDGLDRVGAIVRSLKEFAHPQQSLMATVDLNHVVAGTLTLARNEYKYVADLTTDLGDLPPVTCVAGGISQVVLNLVTNAAHAVGDAVKGTNAKGAITVATRCDGEDVVLSVADTGTGIPADVRPHIFERFFTTKAVGKGTGQGLALVRSVVDVHGGSIAVDTAEGRGTTFVVRLPLRAKGAGAGRRSEEAA